MKSVIILLRPDYVHNTCPSCGEPGGGKPCPVCWLGVFREEMVQLYAEKDAIGVHPWCVQYALDRGFTKAPTSKTTGSSCFIATAVYESPYAHEVTTFRAFRDNHLAQSEIGRLFIETYYATSPPIARLLARSRTLRELSKRIILNPILRAIEKQETDI